MGGERKVDLNSSGKPCSQFFEAREAAFGRIVRAQHGQFTRAQLFEIGFVPNAIDYRLRLGRWHVIHRGVLSIVPRELMTRNAFFMAAVLAGGPGAVLSHRSAAALWGLRGASGARVEITVPRKLGRRSRIRAHRSVLRGDEVTTVDGIPVTSPHRTIFDLAGDLQPHELEGVIGQAQVLRLWDRLSLAELLERYPGRRGTAVLKELVLTGARITRSELEQRFLGLLDGAGLPRPERNAQVETQQRDYEADCLWRPQRLIVELDSRTFHDTPIAFERDRERDRRLAVAGWSTLRITWRQLAREPDNVLADLKALLTTTPHAAPSPRSPPPAPHPLVAGP